MGRAAFGETDASKTSKERKGIAFNLRQEKNKAGNWKERKRRSKGE
jgi:hypothetical protein